jgi:hypothetical protein
MSFEHNPGWLNSIRIGRDRSSSVECIRDCLNVRERVHDCRMMLEGNVRIDDRTLRLRSDSARVVRGLR